MRLVFAVILATASFLTATTSSYAKGHPRPRPVPHHAPPVHVKPHPAHHAKPAVQHHAPPKKPIPKAQKKQPVQAAKHVQHPAHHEAKKSPPAVQHRDEGRFRPSAPHISANRHERHWAAHHWKTYGFSSFNASTRAFQFNSASWRSFAQAANSVGGGGGGGGDGGGEDGGDDVDAVANADLPTDINISAPTIKVTECMPMAKAGLAYAAFLDRLDVEKHWLPGKIVEWKTGKVSDDSDTGPASNAGAFVAAVCARMKVPMPVAADDALLASSQYEWLLDAGKRKNWLKIGEAEAQFLANQGWVVIAAWKNMAESDEQSVAGQTAIVRPDPQPAGAIIERGPRIIMAGVKNHNDISIKDGFPADAWKKYEIVYLAHRPR
jgi:hypothetical protein